MEPYKVIKNPLSTEKAVRLMESENKLLFVVDQKAGKVEVKEAIEKLFSVKVVKVNILNDVKGRKKAYVKLSHETPAIDVATELGLM
ncbi:MAG: 50S ribosomal protein L23 [Nanoarchaeota archaeon]|nr:50S ribosomal protein L23 [Nanoarchaeota archaeon]|tara:strand:+ start:3763 stop:4023 length:261 start_codon:yes stop_codon:yes gene_type:complete